MSYLMVKYWKYFPYSQVWEKNVLIILAVHPCTWGPTQCSKAPKEEEEEQEEGGGGKYRPGRKK